MSGQGLREQAESAMYKSKPKRPLKGCLEFYPLEYDRRREAELEKERKESPEDRRRKLKVIEGGRQK